jgi:hypothetical protein
MLEERPKGSPPSVTKLEFQRFIDRVECLTGEPFCNDYRAVAELVAVCLPFWASKGRVSVREVEWRFQQYLRGARCQVGSQ